MSDGSPVSQQFLDQARHNDLGHRLQALANDFEQRVLARYAVMDYGDIRPVHGSVLRNLGLHGTRLTVMAQQEGVTHRAMAKIVNDLKALGYVGRYADPSDGRASLIVYTERGLSLLNDSSQVVNAIYLDYAECVGGDRLSQLETRLFTFLNRLGLEVSKSGHQSLQAEKPLEGSDGLTYLTHSLGRCLSILSSDYHKRCTVQMHDRKHKGVRFDHLAVLSHLEVTGNKLTTLAERAGISLQAMGKQAWSVEKLGYIKCDIDSSDLRVRRVQFTRKGHVFISDLLEVFEQVKKDYILIVGERNFQLLQKSLSIFISSLALAIPISSSSISSGGKS